MKILVTGATGFIGAAVAKRLSQQGHEVMALARSDAAAAKLRAAGLTPVAGDFANPSSLAAPAAQVDAIVSTASIGQVEGTPDSFAKDRDAVAALTKALGDSGKPLIFTSGSAIFGVSPRARPVRRSSTRTIPRPFPLRSSHQPESAEVPPLFIDAFGGAMAPRAETETAVLKAAGVRGIVIRPGLVYGEGRGYDLSNLIAMAKEARRRASPWRGGRAAGLRPHRRPGGAVRPGARTSSRPARCSTPLRTRYPWATWPRSVSRLVGDGRPNGGLVAHRESVHARRRRRREPVGQQATRQQQDPGNPGMGANAIRHLEGC